MPNAAHCADSFGGTFLTLFMSFLGCLACTVTGRLAAAKHSDMGFGVSTADLARMIVLIQNIQILLRKRYACGPNSVALD